MRENRRTPRCEIFELPSEPSRGCRQVRAEAALKDGDCAHAAAAHRELDWPDGCGGVLQRQQLQQVDELQHIERQAWVWMRRNDAELALADIFGQHLERRQLEQVDEMQSNERCVRHQA